MFDGKGGYETLLGRFRYRAESEVQIENDIRQTLHQFSYQLENVTIADDATTSPSDYNRLEIYVKTHIFKQPKG